MERLCLRGRILRKRPLALLAAASAAAMRSSAPVSPTTMCSWPWPWFTESCRHKLAMLLRRCPLGVLLSDLWQFCDPGARMSASDAAAQPGVHVCQEMEVQRTMSEGRLTRSVTFSPSTAADIPLELASLAELESTLAPSQRASVERLPCTEPETCATAARVVQLLHNAYVQLVRENAFVATDIDLHAQEPEQDPMGVLTSAITFARVVFASKLIRGPTLNIDVRVGLAAVLYIAYKFCADPGANCPCASWVVLTHFLTAGEVVRISRANATNVMIATETELLNGTPVHDIMNRNPYRAFETELHRRMLLSDRDGVRYSEDEFVLALGAGYFYYHAAAANPSCDVLTWMGRTLTSDAIGEALAVVVLTAMRCMHGRVPHIPSAVSRGARAAALALVRNALWRSAEDPRVRMGAYADAQSRVHALVSPETMRAARDAFVVAAAERAQA